MSFADGARSSSVDHEPSEMLVFISSSAGDDENLGESPQAPVRSISRALALCQGKVSQGQHPSCLVIQITQQSPGDRVLDLGCSSVWDMTALHMPIEVRADPRMRTRSFLLALRFGSLPGSHHQTIAFHLKPAAAVPAVGMQIRNVRSGSVALIGSVIGEVLTVCGSVDGSSNHFEVSFPPVHVVGVAVVQGSGETHLTIADVSCTSSNFQWRFPCFADGTQALVTFRDSSLTLENVDTPGLERWPAKLSVVRTIVHSGGGDAAFILNARGTAFTMDGCMLNHVGCRSTRGGITITARGCTVSPGKETEAFHLGGCGSSLSLSNLEIFGATAHCMVVVDGAVACGRNLAFRPRSGRNYALRMAFAEATLSNVYNLCDRFFESGGRNTLVVRFSADSRSTLGVDSINLGCHWQGDRIHYINLGQVVPRMGAKIGLELDNTRIKFGATEPPCFQRIFAPTPCQNEPPSDTLIFVSW
jgi:hypothetical protein